MVGTGMPKFVSMRTIGYIIGAIVLIVAIFVACHYIRAVFGEFIEYPKTGEKNRFMRYMTCAMAMCAAPNIKGGSNDGCTSDKVMETILEYDEGGDPVEGCKQFCEEKRDEVGPIKEHYCGKEYKLEFEFNDGVTYHADDVSVKTFLFDWWKICERIETDVIRRLPWHPFLDGGTCFEEGTTCDYTHGIYGDFPCGKCEGILEKNDNPDPEKPCERIQNEASPVWRCKANTGHIWVDPNLDDQCEELLGDKGWFGNPLYANCTFEVGKRIHIWAEEDTFNGVYCPEIIICKA